MTTVLSVIAFVSLSALHEIRKEKKRKQFESLKDKTGCRC